MKNLLLLIALCFITLCAMAQNVNIKKIGPTTYSVGCYAKPFLFERIVQHTGTGTDLFWDWAACIEMALNYQGLNVQQDQVMSLVNGSIEEPVGSPQDLVVSANKTSPHDWGKDSKIYTTTASIDADVLFEELSAGRPLIVGTRRQGEEGRAYILTAMDFTIKIDANGQRTGIIPVSVTVRDPWPSALATRIINWQDFAPITAMIYTVKVVFK